MIKLEREADLGINNMLKLDHSAVNQIKKNVKAYLWCFKDRIQWYYICVDI